MTGLRRGPGRRPGHEAVPVVRELCGCRALRAPVFTHDAITDGKRESISVPPPQPNRPIPQRLSSWESHLGQSGRNLQPTAHLPPPQNVIAASKVRSPVSAPPQVEWTKVMLAAKMHDQASTSSLAVRLYSPGTDLEVVRREGIWLQVSDPVSQERGWILEKYLSPSKGPGSTQASRELGDTVAVAAPRKSTKLGQSPKRSKSATRVAKQRSAVARWDPYRWGWRADRRRVFMLGPPFARR
jgi:hypothetical protein